MSPERFTADAYLSARLSQVEAMRERYQRIDLLCFDDVDLLRGRESVQVELAVVAEAIKSRGGKMIACSAKSLAEIRAFHPDFLALFAESELKVDRPSRRSLKRYAEERASRLSLALTPRQRHALVQGARTYPEIDGAMLRHSLAAR